MKLRRTHVNIIPTSQYPTPTRMRENGRFSKNQCPRSLTKTNPIYVLMTIRVATKSSKPNLLRSIQSVMTVWANTKLRKSWKSIIGTISAHCGCFSVLRWGSKSNQSFPVGLVGLYHTHPRRKNTAILMMRVHGWRNGTSIRSKNLIISK